MWITSASAQEGDRKAVHQAPSAVDFQLFFTLFG